MEINSNNLKNKGFTLIEMLLVVAMIGVLASILTVNVNSSRQKARVAGGQQFSQGTYKAIGDYAVGVWSFDDGTAKDESGNGNNGTITEATSTNGIIRNALLFDGVNDNISVSNSTSLNPTSITIEMWLYLNSSPDCDANNNWRSLIHKGSASGTTTGYDIVLEQGRNIAWDIGNGAAQRWWPVGISIPIQSWSHLAVSYDAAIGEMRAYQDGLYKGNKVIAPSSITSNANSLIINNASVACPAGSGNFPGKIDEVRVYGKAISSAEIQKHYAESVRNHRFLTELPR